MLLYIFCKIHISFGTITNYSMNSIDSPRAIALHYEYGYMFWSDWGTSAKIERADMDGTNRYGT